MGPTWATLLERYDGQSYELGHRPRYAMDYGPHYASGPPVVAANLARITAVILAAVK